MQSRPDSIATSPDRWSGVRAAIPWAAITTVAGLLPAAAMADLPLRLAAVALLSGGALALLWWLAPGAALGLLPLLTLPPEFGKVFAHEVVLLLVAAGLVVHGVRTRAEWLWRLEPLEVAVAAFTLLGVLSGFWCESTWWWAFGVRKIGIGMLALWTSHRLGRLVRGEDLRLGLAITASALAGYTLIKAAAWGALNTTGWVDRKLSTDLGWGTSNYIAAILVLLLPTAMEVALRDRRPLARVIAWLSMPLALLVMTVTQSRGGVLLLLSIMLISVFRARTNWKTFAVAIMASAVVTGSIWLAGSRLISRFTDAREVGSIVVRLLTYREGWRRLVAAWPLGLGLGQGYATIDRLGPVDPHNYWLVVGAELGLVGLLLWGTILVVLWRRITALVSDPTTRPIGWTLQLTFVLSQVNCLFEPTFSGLHYLFLFFWTVGCYLGSKGISPGAGGRSAR